MKLKDYKGAIDSFERTLDLSKAMGDEVAENAIKSALSDINKKMAQVRIFIVTLLVGDKLIIQNTKHSFTVTR